MTQEPSDELSPSHALAQRVLDFLRQGRQPAAGSEAVPPHPQSLRPSLPEDCLGVLSDLRASCIQLERQFQGVRLKEGQSVRRMWPALGSLLVSLSAVRTLGLFEGYGYDYPEWVKTLFEIEAPADPRLLFFAMESAGVASGAEESVTMVNRLQTGAWLAFSSGVSSAGLECSDPVQRYRQWCVQDAGPTTTSPVDEFVLDLMPEGTEPPRTLGAFALRYAELQGEKVTQIRLLCDRFASTTIPAIRQKQRARIAEMTALFLRGLSALSPAERQALLAHVAAGPDWPHAANAALHQLSSGTEAPQ